VRDENASDRRHDVGAPVSNRPAKPEITIDKFTEQAAKPAFAGQGVVFEPERIEQVGRDFLAPARDQDIMAAPDALCDGLTEEMDMGRMADIDQYTHMLS
jgi:hypothetical protein